MINLFMIYIGSDHGGFKFKEKLKIFLEKQNYTFTDLGNKKYDSIDDYPIFVFNVAMKIGELDDSSKVWEERPKGILLCRSSGGMVVAANKVKNVSAISVFDKKSAEHARLHNDCNVIALSGDWLSEEEMFDIVKTWLTTEFSKEERHIRRINMIKEFELK
mgnify:FL=1